MKTGTGITRANGDTPDPFAVTVMFTQHKLELLHGRFTMVLVGLILITLYLIGSTIVGVLTPADFIFLLGVLFLAYRLSELRGEIRKTEQYLHGEGLPALD
jgi:hypothetical protein